MFVQTITTGVIQENTQFNIRFYWLEFINSCLPFLYANLGTVVIPITEALVTLIKDHKSVMYISTGCKDVLMVLKCLEEILMYVLIKTKDYHIDEPQEKSKSGLIGFTKLFNNMVGASSPSADTYHMLVKLTLV